MLQSLMLFVLATLYFPSISVAQEKRTVSVYSGDSVATEWGPPIRHDTVGADSVGIVHKVLSAFYLSTNGDQWTNNSGWNVHVVPTSMEDFNQWQGLTVTDGRLVEISIRQNELTGSLPPELGTLVTLHNLDLRFNRIRGPIPSELSNLPSLIALRLGHNELIGQIPTELSNLSRLQILNLPNNSLIGPIPPEVGELTNLLRLNLSHNHFSGSIPPELGKLSDLQLLYLYDNYFSGPIPAEIGGLDSLRALIVSDNQLSGPLPPELGNLSKLRTFWMNSNKITGSIPPELGKLSRLKSMWLGINQLTGSIPNELGKLSELASLWLGVNDLTGPIPPTLGDLTMLEELNLYDNQLTGFLPSELGNLSELTSLSLGNNQLVGQLPRSLMQLNLEGFDFRGNSGLCAPTDDEFQNWLSNINYVYAAPHCTSSVSTEQDGPVPEIFAVQGNYPNPVQTSMTLRFDLPWNSHVWVEILDVAGRRVLLKSPVEVPAGWGREVSLSSVRPKNACFRFDLLSVYFYGYFFSLRYGISSKI